MPSLWTGGEVMSGKLFRIAFLRSTYDSKYTAFCINDLRFGVDAGPWKVEFETSGRIEDLFRAIPELKELIQGQDVK